MKIHIHTVLEEEGKHLKEVGKKVTIEYMWNDEQFDSIEKILSLFELMPNIEKTETASTSQSAENQ